MATDDASQHETDATLDPARYQRVMDVYRAVESLNPSERAAALERSCRDAPELRAEVEALLARDRAAARLLGRVAPEPRVESSADATARRAWEDEQRRYLFERVRLLGLSLAVVVATMLVRATVVFQVQARLGVFELCGMLGGGLLVVGLCVVVLGLRSPSLERLRRVELALLASVALAIFSWGHAWLTHGAARTADATSQLQDLLHGAYWVASPGGVTHYRIGYSQIAFPVYANWLAAMGLHGMLIPNARRRGAQILAVMIAGSVANIVDGAIANPAFRPFVVGNGITALVMMTMFGALVHFGGLRIQALRKEAFEARQIGQYRLMRILGKGAMGEVYLARHWLLRRPCAVKFIRPEQAGSPEVLVRFEREVQVMAQLTHPNTVEIYDFGRTEDGAFFYAMEYLPGMTLDSLVRAYGPLPAGRTIYLLRQVCGALAEAHDKGLVHRDVKPANMFVCERGGTHDVVKLLDFGIVHVARTDDAALATQPTPAAVPAVTTSASAPPPPPAATTEPDGTLLTSAGQLLGTPAYMAPEQVRGAALDARSDIYCVGGVACFLLSGRPPFERDTLEEMAQAHLDATPPQLADVPAAFAALVARCLAKDPRQRFPNARALDAALAALDEARDWDSARADAWWRAHPLPSDPAADSTDETLSQTVGTLGRTRDPT